MAAASFRAAKTLHRLYLGVVPRQTHSVLSRKTVAFYVPTAAFFAAAFAMVNRTVERTAGVLYLEGWLHTMLLLLIMMMLLCFGG